MVQKPDTADQSELLSFRCDSEIREKLDEEAERLGISVSGMIRMCIRSGLSRSTFPNKGIDTSTDTPTPYGDSEMREVGKDIGESYDGGSVYRKDDEGDA